MAADLHIHIADGLTEEDFKCFFSNTFGSKYFAGLLTIYKCAEQAERDRLYRETLNEFREENNWIDGPITNKPKDVQEKWQKTLRKFNAEHGFNCSHTGRVIDSPSIWIGEVSWLKAALTEDSETFVPNPVKVINKIIGEDLPVLDRELKERILDALDSENNTSYNTADRESVENFLDSYMGSRLFTVSW